jgi:predicted  nucleic acid-binding Zn-ribbon protein
MDRNIERMFDNTKSSLDDIFNEIGRLEDIITDKDNEINRLQTEYIQLENDYSDLQEQYENLREQLINSQSLLNRMQ